MDTVTSPRYTLSRLLAGMSLFAVSMTCAQAQDHAFHHLSGGEIRERIVGHEVGDDVHWRDHLFANGSVAGYVWGDPNPGEWSINADRLCIARWNGMPEPTCFDVWIAGDQLQLRHGQEIMATGHVAAPLAPKSVHTAPTLELVSTIALPGVKGRIDHLSVDVNGHRIFVAALGNDTVEIIDTQRDRHGSITGLGEPQGVLYLPGSDRLFIANGGTDRVEIIDATSRQVLKRIEGLADADNLRYDAAERKVVVGYGHGALRFIDPESGEATGDVGLPGHPESFQLEEQGTRAFVNVPTARAVVVVDRRKRVALANWSTAGAFANFPMALDESSHRLFVGARTPPTLLVLDTESGKAVTRLSIGADADDLFFDALRKRIYAICGEGKVDVIRQQAPDRYVMQESIKTAPRARTGLFVPEENRLYVAAPAEGGNPARVLVFHVQ